MRISGGPRDNLPGSADAPLGGSAASATSLSGRGFWWSPAAPTMRVSGQNR